MPTSDNTSDHRQARFVVWWYRLILVGAFAIFIVLLFSLLLSAGSNPAALAFVGFAMVAMVGMLFRALQSATIEISDDGVAIRGLLQTRRINWSEIQAVEVGRGSSVTLLPWRVPCFELTDGSVIRAEDVRSLRDGSIVDDVVDEARRRIGHR